MTKIFLTGGTGFIGGNLVGKLLERGYQVKVLVRDEKKLAVIHNGIAKTDGIFSSARHNAYWESNFFRGKSQCKF